MQKNKRIVVLSVAGLLLLGSISVIARTHVCFSSYLYFLNLTGGRVQVSVLDSNADYFMWSGWVEPHVEPLLVRPVNDAKSYLVFVQDKNGKVIAEGVRGYDERWARDHNFFIIDKDGLLFTSWPNAKTFIGNLIYLAKSAIGDAISCPLLMAGLSPESIPESIPSTISPDAIFRLQAK
jgi:hypothetical protein